MSPYDNWQFNFAFKLNQAIRRPGIRGIKMRGCEAKNDMCLADLIKWVNRNPQAAAKKSRFHNYERFLKNTDMNNIVSIYKNRRYGKFHGFSFNTDIQSHVESFMGRIHVSNKDYFLSMENDAPEGIYTQVKVTEIKDNEGKLVNLRFYF